MSECCYICERKLNGRFEKDHFPKSACNGGTEVLPICVSCHSDKDRIGIKNWDSSFLGVLAGLWQKLDRDERLFIAKMIHVMNQLYRTMEVKKGI